jgi:NAD(P)-dependent dehydrogenase (short-subunit alcohol dehydrogenase family)
MTWNIEGRTVLVTGGNSGIGRASAAAMAARGANAVITTRDSSVGARVAEELTASVGRSVRSMTLDLSDPSSTNDFAAQFLGSTSDLALLVNNAGVMLGRRTMSVDGFEMTFRVNHLGHFHLTCLLRDRLVDSAPARVITVASAAHYSADRIELDPAGGLYRGFRTYARSKLANVLFGGELGRRLAGTGVSSFSLDPGVVATRIAQDGDTTFAGIAWKLMSYRMLTPEQGAATTLYAATDPQLEEHTGAYLSDSQIADPSALARDAALASRLWDLSEEAVGCRF